MGEQWRPVTISDDYEVSDAGNVRRVTRTRGAVPGRILRPRRMPFGHLRVALAGVPNRDQLIHRLVMAAFVGPCPEGKEVNHINSDPSDNRLSNLEYVTSSENARHGFARGHRKGPRGEKNGAARLTVDQVQEIRSMRGVERQADTALRFGVSRSLIGAIQRSEVWAHVA